MAIVCAVGESLRGDARLATRVLGALEGLPLAMVSQGGSRKNITFVLRDDDVKEAMERLHRRFFGGRASPRLTCAMRSWSWDTVGWAGWSSSSRRSTASRWPACSTRPRTPAAPASAPSAAAACDVAIDFTTADATLATAPRLAALGVNIVVGTTGWQAREAELREAIAAAQVGAVVSANFSRAANLLEALVERAGGLFAGADSYGAFIHEAHHEAKKDAPSGTALMLRRAIERGGYTLPVDVSSTRAGCIPGTHTVGFDGPAETMTLTHAARDRATFAHGALEAARWVIGPAGLVHDEGRAGDRVRSERCELRSRAAAPRW